MYIKRQGDVFLIIVLYVDGMLIARKSIDEITTLKQKLSESFAMKDLVHASHFLGVYIKRNRKKGVLELSHKSYIQKLLEHF